MHGYNKYTAWLDACTKNTYLMYGIQQHFLGNPLHMKLKINRLNIALGRVSDTF